MSQRLQDIVVATDFNAPSDVALRRAAALARRQDARLQLLHVFADRSQRRGALLPQRTETATAIPHGERKRACEQRLGQMAARLQEAAPLAVSHQILEGKPAEEISRFVDEVGSDLVVIGQDEASGLRRVLGATTALRLLRRLPSPLLISKDADVPSYQRILVPVDFGAACRRGVALARHWFEQAELHLLHVVPVQVDLAPTEVAWAGTISQQADEAALREAHSRLAQFALECGTEISRIRLHVRQGNIATAVADCADENDAQLVVVGSDCSALIGGLAPRLMQEAPRDVLLINTTKAIPRSASDEIE